MPAVLVALLLSSFSFATVSIRNVECPVKFEGTVKEVVDSVGSTGSFATRSVVFKTNQECLILHVCIAPVVKRN